MRVQKSPSVCYITTMNNKQKDTHPGIIMYKDKRKRIYTITIIARSTGTLYQVYTISGKKHAESRLARLQEIYFAREKDGKDNERMFNIVLTETRLEREVRNMGQL